MNHTIQRLTVEISAADQEEASRRHGELSRWCRADSLWHKLSEKLSSIVPDDIRVQISKLEIEVDLLDEKSFQDALIEKVMDQIRELPSFSGDLINGMPEEYVRQLTLIYLKNGFFPPQISSEKAARVSAFLKNQTSDPDLFFWADFARHTCHSPQILTRLIRHLGLDSAREIVIRLLRDTFRASVTVEWIEDFWMMSPEMHNVTTPEMLATEENLWLYFLQNTSHAALKTREAFLEHCYEMAISENENVGGSSQGLSAVKLDISKKLTTECAGLVLLSPFLPQLFGNLGWIKGNVWTGEEKQHLAVQLLGYLAYGTTDYWEIDALLPKILCGLPQETVIDQDASLTRQHLNIAEELLVAAIGFWKTLKSISPQDLRDLFLKRRGFFNHNAATGDWHLEVEKMGQDVLMEGFPETGPKPGVEGIPWGFGVVRLPWMRNTIFVKW